MIKMLDMSVVLICSILIFVFIFIGYITKRFQNKDIGNTKFSLGEKDINDCTNPNCVRCQLYSEVICTAKEKLEHFIDINAKNTDIKRIKSSLLDNNNGVHDKQWQNPNVFALPDLESQGWFEQNVYQMDVDILKENFSVIFSDFCTIMNENHDNLWLRNNTPTGCWSVFHLVNQGKVVEENTDICNNTFAIVNTLPSLMCSNVFGNVLFSVIEPGTVISQHHGPTNLRVRCHLGLQSSRLCTLTVGDTSKTWTEKDCILFDDSYLHGVHHRGGNEDGHRAVLIVDLWHIGVKEEEKTALDYIFAPVN